MIIGKKFHIDLEFESERLVDDVIVLEEAIGKYIYVYSPKLRANIIIPRKELDCGQA